MNQELDIESARAELSAIIGVDIPPSVAEKALHDSRYRYHLISAKSNPAWLQKLINLVPASMQQPAPAHSALGLGMKLVSSVVRHALTGFRSIEPDVLGRRWAACQRCPHLVAPPDRAVYHLGRRIVAGDGEDERICQMCGCFALPKARKPTEECPVADPNNSEMTRWGEPRTS